MPVRRPAPKTLAAIALGATALMVGTANPAIAKEDPPGKGHYCATPSQLTFYPGIKTGKIRYGNVSIAITACKESLTNVWAVDAFPVTNGIGLTARHEILTQRINGPIDENSRSITTRILMKSCPIRTPVCYYPATWDVKVDLSRDENRDVVENYTVTRVDERIGYVLYDTPSEPEGPTP